MARAKKLPSGSWRVQVYTGMVDGKRKYISITAPTEKEANYAALQYQMGVDRKARIGKTVGEAIDDYIAMRDGVLSPTTILGYQQIRRCYVQELMGVPIKQLTEEMMQAAFNAQAKAVMRGTHKPMSPKTLRNVHGLVMASVRAVAPTFNAKITLPSRQKQITTMLTPEQVFDLVRGTEIELPVLLAMWMGLSMSEIRGLDDKSIRDGVLTVSKATIDMAGETIEKDKTKAYERTRQLELPPYILGLIPQEQGKLVKLTARALYQRWVRMQRRAGYDPQMSFHALRHLNASVMLALGVPDKYAMERGGWATNAVMKNVYQHTFSDERMNTDKRIDNFFERFV